MKFSAVVLIIFCGVVSNSYAQVTARTCSIRSESQFSVSLRAAAENCESSFRYRTRVSLDQFANTAVCAFRGTALDTAQSDPMQLATPKMRAMVDRIKRNMGGDLPWPEVLRRVRAGVASGYDISTAVDVLNLLVWPPTSSPPPGRLGFETQSAIARVDALTDDTTLYFWCVDLPTIRAVWDQLVAIAAYEDALRQYRAGQGQ